MSGARVQVRGADTLARTLRACGDDLADLADAHHAAGALVAREASVRARRDTGRLAGSFTVDATPDGPVIGSALVYAPVQEFGWPAHSISPSRALTAALDAAQRPALAVYGRAVDTAVGKVRGT